MVLYVRMRIPTSDPLLHLRWCEPDHLDSDLTTTPNPRYHCATSIRLLSRAGTSAYLGCIILAPVLETLIHDPVLGYCFLHSNAENDTYGTATNIVT